MSLYLFPRSASQRLSWLKSFYTQKGMSLRMQRRTYFSNFVFPLFLLCIALLISVGTLFTSAPGRVSTPVALAAGSDGSLARAFAQASKESAVPVSLLEALCYMEGRLSNHGGTPSIDGGYGCMHLVKNDRVDTLDSAAGLLHVSADQLKSSMTANIRGGAMLLRQDALKLSTNHTLPTTLANWYGALVLYSNATTLSTAYMYADAVYKLLNSGFTARAQTSEMVTLTAQHVSPNTATASAARAATTLPQGCVNDGKTDYPGAIDCIVNPSTFDCNATSPCTYNSSNRPTSYPLLFVTIHDTEGSLQDALNIFQDPSKGVSIHYLVDTDGTVYQLLHEKDIAFHNGNYWYNERSVGIEHVGYDATGYQWYNAAEYLGSAKLVAYLLKKYNIPLDHDHIMAHGTTPAPTVGSTPNHVDPGPYWLWDYYFDLINQQGVDFPVYTPNNQTVVLHASSGVTPYGSNGAETSANFNFFNLYTSASTSSALIPNASSGSDSTDETYNVESALCYYYVATASDAAGTGDTMYEIWYGESNNLPSSQSMNGKLAWLAVPPGAGTSGYGTLVKLTASSPAIYGEPVASSTYKVGAVPTNAIFDATFSLTISGTVWYSINYNHRPMWVPASEVSVI